MGDKFGVLSSEFKSQISEVSGQWSMVKTKNFETRNLLPFTLKPITQNPHPSEVSGTRYEVKFKNLKLRT